MAKTETPTAEIRQAALDWRSHEKGFCDAGNISRRGMKSWSKLDRNHNYIGLAFEDELLDRGAYDRNDFTNDALPFSPGSDRLQTVWREVQTRGKRYYLTPDERRVAVIYWRERLTLLARFGSLRFRHQQSAFATQVRACARKTKAILAEMGVDDAKAA